ncbi:MAG TPA: AAA family ATPase [Pyrinomonadaceae bacterium]|nr:AAA family ATPase [Pyrinomonadaceae bacterium]
MTEQGGPMTASGPKSANSHPDTDLISLLARRVVGQSGATNAIVPYVYMYQSGLAPAGRPAGVFLLLGPTGTGKTKTVEAIADLLHGSEKLLVKIDCGEFQLDHETAKLIGAPPGYLGHRETVPMLTQQALKDATSLTSDLALVLFDEIEKASPSLTKLLLGILDRGTLRLGDNTEVNFERSLIFFTSNLGAREMMKEINPEIGFHPNLPKLRPELSLKLENIALGAVRKRFSPEFVNRIDAIVTYQPLDQESLEAILDHDIRSLQTHVNTRLGDRCFQIDVSPESRQFLLRKGVSQEYGARELKRTMHRELTQPLATMVARGDIAPGAMVRISLVDNNEKLSIVPEANPEIRPAKRPSILLVDDNHDLLLFLAVELKEAGWEMLVSENAAHARELFARYKPNVVLVDYMLGDDDGLQLALEFQREKPSPQVIVMTGGGLTEEGLMICDAADVPILYKPFLAKEVLNLIRGRFYQVRAAVN